MDKNYAYTSSKIMGNHSSISNNDSFETRRRPASMRQSQRKPIFDKNMYFSTVAEYGIKRPMSSSFAAMPVNQVSRDDYCGCEHNLDPCPHIEVLMKGLSERDMRNQYDRVDSISPKLSKMELKRKYLRYLPPQYPELYHAQLANIVSNMGRDLGFNEFIALASIEYHAKLEHLTYFLFTDLQKSLSNKKKFFSNLELHLIKHEVNYPQLVQYCRVNGIPLESFLTDFYESAGAIIIPLSQYAIFLKLLLKQGSSIKLRLLVYLMVKKRDSLLQLVKCYSKSLPYLREQSRQLPWETFLREIKDE